MTRTCIPLLTLVLFCACQTPQSTGEQTPRDSTQVATEASADRGDAASKSEGHVARIEIRAGRDHLYVQGERVVALEKGSIPHEHICCGPPEKSLLVKAIRDEVASFVSEMRPSSLHITHSVDELTPYVTLVRMTYSSHQAIGKDLLDDYSFDVQVGSSPTIDAPDKPPLTCSKEDLAACREQLRLTVVLSEDALKVAKFSKNQFRQDTDGEELANLTKQAREKWSTSSERGLERLGEIKRLYDWEALSAFLKTTKAEEKDAESHDADSLFISMEPWLPCQAIRWMQAANCENAPSEDCNRLFDNVYLAIPQ